MVLQNQSTMEMLTVEVFFLNIRYQFHAAHSADSTLIGKRTESGWAMKAYLFEFIYQHPNKGLGRVEFFPLSKLGSHQTPNIFSLVSTLASLKPLKPWKDSFMRYTNLLRLQLQSKSLEDHKNLWLSLEMTYPMFNFS